MDAVAVGEALSVSVQAGVPVLLWGSPGLARPPSSRALGESLGWPTEIVIGSIREPADFAGLPVVINGSVEMAPPLWARRLAATGYGLLFLDELTTAPPAVQAAMLRVVLERVVGDLTLPEGVRVVAAANPPEEAADGWQLSPPLANRLVHLDWPVDAKAVSRGIALGFPQPPSFDGRVPTDTQTVTARATVGAFLEVRPALVLDVPAVAEQAGRGWPSPRELGVGGTPAGRVRRRGGVRGCTDVPGARRGRRGGGHRVPVVAGQHGPPRPRGRPGRSGRLRAARAQRPLFAVLSAVAAVAVSRGNADSWSAAWRVVERVADQAPDVAARRRARWPAPAPPVPSCRVAC